MQNLVQNFDLALESLEDPALRNEVEWIVEGLTKMEIEVLPVGRARELFSPLLERLHGGGAALIADRGVLKDTDDTTVMMSLQTLQRLFVMISEKIVQYEAERCPLSEMLVGLRPVPASVENFEVEYAAGAQDADDAEAGVEL